MIESDGYVCIAKAVDTPISVDFKIPSKFQWPIPNKENDKQNTDAYLEYLQSIAQDFKELHVKKSIEAPNLNTTVGMNPHHLKGKADLYVIPIDCELVSRNQLVMVLEMKPNDLTSNNVAQAIGYVIAANSLFDIPGRPAPVGVLSDFVDQWVLVWVGKAGEIFYSQKEKDINGNKKKLTRETAMYYIRKHFYRYDKLLRDEDSKKRRAENASWAFDGFEAGILKKVRYAEPEDSMRDVLETREEIALYDMAKRLGNTPLFQVPPPAETFSYYS